MCTSFTARLGAKGWPEGPPIVVGEPRARQQGYSTVLYLCSARPHGAHVGVLIFHRGPALAEVAAAAADEPATGCAARAVPSEGAGARFEGRPTVPPLCRPLPRYGFVPAWTDCPALSCSLLPIGAPQARLQVASRRLILHVGREGRAGIRRRLFPSRRPPPWRPLPACTPARDAASTLLQGSFEPSGSPWYESAAGEDARCCCSAQRTAGGRGTERVFSCCADPCHPLCLSFDVRRREGRCCQARRLAHPLSPRGRHRRCRRRRRRARLARPTRPPSCGCAWSGRAARSHVSLRRARLRRLHVLTAHARRGPPSVRGAPWPWTDPLRERGERTLRLLRVLRRAARHGGPLSTCVS